MLSNNAQRGFSIIEVMVALTISLIIMASLSYLLVNNVSARAELDKSMQQIENGRYAMEFLKNELRLTGYYGPAYSVGSSATSTDPCATDATTMKGALPLAVQGYALASSSSNPLSTCINSNNLTTVGNDILVLRRAYTNSVAVASAVAGTLYLQTNGDATATPILAIASSSASTNTSTYTLTAKGVTAPLRQYQVQIYFISPCDVPVSGTNCTGASDDNGKPIPTLKRIVLPSSPTPESLIQGVERFTVEYGEASSLTSTEPASYVSAGSVTNWLNVVAVKVHVLARNITTTVGYTDTKSYTVGPVSIAAANDGYKRHVFDETVLLTNVSGRREGL